MADKPRPTPCYLDSFDVYRVIGNKKVWCNSDKSRFFTWDGLHGEIEVYNRSGLHLGVADAVTGATIKPSVKGRYINLK